MPGYIKKMLQKYKHHISSKPQHCPYSPSPKQYGAKAQQPLPINISPKLSLEEIKEIQCIISCILYYARAINISVLMALSSIAIKQTKGTTSTMEKANQCLDYLVTNPNATMRFRVSDMIMNVHSDTLYLSKANTCSRACRNIFLWVGLPKTATLSNSTVHFLPYVPSSVLSSCLQLKPNLELSFSTAKRVKFFRMTLEELGHLQPKTMVNCNNATAVGIANITV